MPCGDFGRVLRRMSVCMDFNPGYEIFAAMGREDGAERQGGRPYERGEARGAAGRERACRKRERFFSIAAEEAWREAAKARVVWRRVA